MLLEYTLSERIKGSFVEADRCLNCWDAPCNSNCPAGINVSSFIRSLSKGDYVSAAEIIESDNLFGYICGWICPQEALCQKNCIAKKLGRAIDIRTLQRFAIDIFRKNYKKSTFFNDYKFDKLNINISEKNHIENIPKIPNYYRKRKKVAIIGAGPAGLTAAYDLEKLGYTVTVFEVQSSPGGMMYSGIPGYRLSKEVLKGEIKQIEEAGVKILLNTPIRSKEEFEKLREDYQAIFIAIGAQRSKKLRVEGSDLKGVLYGIEFLKDVNIEKEVPVGERIAVIGGGNVAIDVALSSLRLGAKEVHLFCLESREEMPAFEWEIEEAIREGVNLHCSRGPKRIIGKEGKISGLETILCASVFDAEGRFSPQFKEKTESSIEVDTVIIAIGQEADFVGFEEVKVTPYRTIDADKISLATSIPGVFAGGDIIGRGRSAVVHAVADGKQAAISIHKYLSNRGKNIG